MSNIILRNPTVDDAISVLSLIRNCNPLDENSQYLYVLLCDQFSKTCVIAELDSKVVGFLSSFISPKNPDTLFIWQAAVSEKFRNKGMAKNLLSYVLNHHGNSIKNLVATVTSSNKSSLKFLKNFSKDLGADFSIKTYYSSKVLGSNHESEDLVTIGPIPKQLKEITV